MRVYIKLISALLALVFVLSAVSLLVASAEDFAYTQPEKFIYGDVNLDGTVTVKDVTLIQKGLAKITYVTAVQKYLTDPEGTGYSVKNATAIQKYLANYEVSPLFGTEIVMASQDEFSGDIWDVDTYYDDCIVVYPKDNITFDYNVEDFPEYKFSKIEKHVLNYNKITYYILYLEEPGMEKVVDAVKALDYRANIDLRKVRLSYYLNAS